MNHRGRQCAIYCPPALRVIFRGGGTTDSAQNQPGTNLFNWGVVIGNERADTANGIKWLGAARQFCRVEKPFSQAFEVSDAGIGRRTGSEPAGHQQVFRLPDIPQLALQSFRTVDAHDTNVVLRLELAVRQNVFLDRWIS